MAFNSIFIPRFSSSTIRSPGRSISLLNSDSLGGQFLPVVRFSTDIERKIAGLLKFKPNPKETAKPAEEVNLDGRKMSLRTNMNDKYTKAVVRGDTYYKSNDIVIGTDPKISMKSMVANLDGTEIEYEAVVEPQKINIQSIKLRDNHLSIFEGYLSFKGIDAKMLDILFNFLGKQQPKGQFIDGLNALLRPFKIKDGGPEAGYLTLIKKGKYEIIEVKVRPRYLINEHEVETYKMDLGDIKSLNVLVDIRFGVDYKECLKFYLVAYPNKIHIRSMYRTSAEGSTEHLEEYEESFKKKRVMKPNRLKDDLSHDIMKFFLECVHFGRTL